MQEGAVWGIEMASLRSKDWGGLQSLPLKSGAPPLPPKPDKPAHVLDSLIGGEPPCMVESKDHS